MIQKPGIWLILIFTFVFSVWFGRQLVIALQGWGTSLSSPAGNGGQAAPDRESLNQLLSVGDGLAATAADGDRGRMLELLKNI